MYGGRDQVHLLEENWTCFDLGLRLRLSGFVLLPLALSLDSTDRRQASLYILANKTWCG